MSETRGLSFLRPRTLWALLLVIPGCEGESVVDRPASGVYQVVDWTVDENSCDGDGRSVAAPDSRPEFVRVQTTQVGPAKLVVSSCKDELCEPIVRSGRGTADEFYWVMDQLDGTMWNGTQIDIRESTYGCEAARTEVSVAITSQDRIWVAVRRHAAVHYLADSDYVCTGATPSRACSLTTAEEVTADQPCMTQERMGAMMIDRDVRPPREDWPRDQDPLENIDENINDDTLPPRPDWPRDQDPLENANDNVGHHRPDWPREQDPLQNIDEDLDSYRPDWPREQDPLENVNAGEGIHRPDWPREQDPLQNIDEDLDSYRPDWPRDQDQASGASGDGADREWPRDTDPILE